MEPRITHARPLGRLRNNVEQALGPMGRLRNNVEQEFYEYDTL